MPPVLELRDIVKEFSGHRVLRGVSLSVERGSVHALLGENGAGKSTLMNILFGMPIDPPSGKRLRRADANGARAHGLRASGLEAL